MINQHRIITFIPVSKNIIILKNQVSQAGNQSSGDFIGIEKVRSKGLSGFHSTVFRSEG